MKAGLYESLVFRSRGRCEACSLPFGQSMELRPEADHFFGKAKADEDESTVWLIHASCHVNKHAARPSAAHHLKAFLVHAEKYGFRAAYDRAFRRLQYVEQRAAFGKGAA
jgi:hypothetical protein